MNGDFIPDLNFTQGDSECNILVYSTDVGNGDARATLCFDKVDLMDIEREFYSFFGTQEQKLAYCGAFALGALPGERSYDTDRALNMLCGAVLANVKERWVSFTVSSGIPTTVSARTYDNKEEWLMDVAATIDRSARQYYKLPPVPISLKWDYWEKDMTCKRDH